MIEESVKAEIVAAIIENFQSFTFGGQSYTLQVVRQDQEERIAYPELVVAFLEDVPQKGFLGHRIGTYVDSEDNRLPLRGWLSKQRVHSS